jgi:predicted alpha/beta-fold hydrolase
VGISLGGNALSKWAGESGAQALHLVQAVAAVCSPLDLAASGRAMGQGFNRHVYTRMFLNTMIPKALQKWKQFPHLFDAPALQKAKTLYEFDDLFTAPLHGYKNTEDYWSRASALPVLHKIQVPSLLLNAKNDPFIPASSLPTPQQVSSQVSLWQPRHGGHVGFPSHHWQQSAQALFMEMPSAVGAWLFHHR